jgi:phage terminase large subunit
MSRILEYTPRDQFLPFHNRPQRWAILNTHRRAGKTVALVNDIIVGSLQCQLRKPQHAYVGPTFTQTKRIAWSYMKDYSEPYWSKPPSESELKVTLHGDRTIYCLGADNPDSLRGMYLDGGAGDEYALYRPSVFSQVIRPALSDRNGWWVFASTPRGKNLFHKEWKKAISNPSQYFHLELRADTSGIMSPSELEELRRDMDPEEFAQEYLCSFDSALKGAIYAEEVNQLFIDQRVRPDIYEPSLPTNVVFDLGFTDATVAIYWQENPVDQSIRVVNVEATSGKDIFYHIERITQFSAQADLGEVWLPHDAKAKNLQTGKSIVEQFIDSQIRPRIVPDHKVRDRLAATRKLFPRIYIDSAQDGCDDLLEALKGYRREWDDNLLAFKEKPYHDWCSDYADAFGYLCVVAAPRFATSSSSDMTVAPRQSNIIPLRSPSNYNLETLHSDREAHLAKIQRIS